MTRASKAVASSPNPYLHLTDAQLADVLGAMEAADDALKARIKRAREVAEARGLDRLRGLNWLVTRSVGNIDRLDSKGLKKTFGLEWYAKWTKPGTRTTWTATAVEDLPAPLQPCCPPPSG